MQFVAFYARPMGPAHSRPIWRRMLALSCLRRSDPSVVMPWRDPSLFAAVWALAAVLCISGGRHEATTAQAPEASPAPRHGSAMAYDPVTKCVVLFGGVNHLLKPSTRYDDTWTWDGQRWTLASTTGPTARIWPSMAADLRSGKMVLFGGSDGKRCLGDSWFWDGNRWSGREHRPDIHR